MFENPRRGRQAKNFTTNAPKILDLKSSSEQIFSRKLPLGAPDTASKWQGILQLRAIDQWKVFCASQSKFMIIYYVLLTYWLHYKKEAFVIVELHLWNSCRGTACLWRDDDTRAAPGFSPTLRKWAGYLPSSYILSTFKVAPIPGNLPYKNSLKWVSLGGKMGAAGIDQCNYCCQANLIE